MKQITPTTDRRTLLAELARARAEAEHWRRQLEARINASTPPQTEAELNRQTLALALKGTVS